MGRSSPPRRAPQGGRSACPRGPRLTQRPAQRAPSRPFPEIRGRGENTTGRGSRRLQKLGFRWVRGRVKIASGRILRRKALRDFTFSSFLCGFPAASEPPSPRRPGRGAGPRGADGGPARPAYRKRGEGGARSGPQATERPDGPRDAGPRPSPEADPEAPNERSRHRPLSHRVPLSRTSHWVIFFRKICRTGTFPLSPTAASSLSTGTLMSPSPWVPPACAHPVPHSPQMVPSSLGS